MDSLQNKERVTPYIKVSKAPSFNISDFKDEKTLFLENTPKPQQQQSPFEPNEFSARSTAYRGSNKLFTDLDFDEIMRTSHSEVARDKYRESIGMGRLSQLPRTADISRRTSSCTNPPDDFWSDAQISNNSFAGKQIDGNDEEFRAAEYMTDILAKDEIEQEMEYAAIPRVQKSYSGETTKNWDISGLGLRTNEFSFGQFCKQNVKSDNPRDVFAAKSPPKKAKRGGLIDVSTNESVIMPNKKLPLNGDLEDLIRGCNTPRIESLLKNGNSSSRQLPNPGGINWERLEMPTEKEQGRLKKAEKENERTQKDNIPVKDRSNLSRSKNQILQAPQMRGLKRRSSSASSDTPRSALDKCLRSKSPNNRQELDAAAARLKPKFPSNNEPVFKIPSTSRRTDNSSSILKSTSGHEYVTAMQSMSIGSPKERLSIPNYALQRPDKTFASHSVDQWSPSVDAPLKRTISQLSSGSEFGGDYMPLKINTRKLSWQSVKLRKTVSKQISIQNTSDKKLFLSITVEGPGFTISLQDFRYLMRSEVRTFNVEFCPTVVGPARGTVFFGISNGCSKCVPLFAYGGHFSLKVEGPQKGPFGPTFITMGMARELNHPMVRTIRLHNNGTLPGFVKFMFRTDHFKGHFESLSVEPNESRLEPGKMIDIRLTFRPTKEEIRKILQISDEVITFGEVQIIYSDEATRMRLLKNKDCVDAKSLEYLPRSLPDEAVIQRQLFAFNENLSRGNLDQLLDSIKIYDFALTINRCLDETQLQATDLTLSDETHMSFVTFCDMTVMNPSNDATTHDVGILESKFFRISPAEIVFDRLVDRPDTIKTITVESISDEKLFVETVSSNSDLVSATRSGGFIESHGVAIVNVSAKDKAFEKRVHENVAINVMIRSCKVEIPVKFID